MTSNLLWPGDQRAGAHMTDNSLWEAMIRVETAWLRILVDEKLAPGEASGCDLLQLVGPDDMASVADNADSGGNPVIGLVSCLRARAPEVVRPWIHRGLTSQDVLDSGLVLAMSDSLKQIRAELREQISALSTLADRHRETPMVARTLTQHAVPTTFGMKSASWLTDVCDAALRAAQLKLPIQIGGAAGTLAASTELAALLHGVEGASDTAMRLTVRTATALGLEHRLPWHTNRAPITAFADTLVSCTDAWGHAASDIVTLTRPEIDEVREPVGPGRGGSSTMPDKQNPVLAILLRRAAIAAPPLAATLHTAAALVNDERPDGAWHVEWDTIRTLTRRTLIAASHATELLSGLAVDADRMRVTLRGAHAAGEQLVIASLVQKPSSPSYFGASDQIITAALHRAAYTLEELL